MPTTQYLLLFAVNLAFILTNLPSACLHCDVAHLCFGGCPKDRLVERITLNGPERRNYLCPGYKMFFRYISQKIKTKK